MSAIDLKMPSLAFPLNGLKAKIAIGLFAAVTADWLFLGETEFGLSVVLFLCLLALASIAVNPLRASGRNLGVAFAVLVAGLIVLLEDVGPVSLLLGVGAILIFALMTIEGKSLRLAELSRRAAQLPFLGPFWLVADINRANKTARETRGPTRLLPSLLAWIVPLIALLVFGALFASANPLLESWLSQIDLWFLFNPEFLRRLSFWALILCLIWPLLALRLSPKKETVAALPAAQAEHGPLFGESAIQRSLILLNALFAMQTAMDLAYLWGGMPLPQGMSYAAYAHRGAYPLVLTALLAAAFVLIVMRRSGPAEKSKWIRPLVLVWVGQNVLLVISSILRLNLYVAFYSLTYLRLAAFIWMGLVAVGLILVVVQIVWRKPNGWLLEMNFRALALALFGACLLNAPAFVAEYNVAHCREVRGAGASLDQGYLWSLGPQVIPALDTFYKRVVPSREINGLSARKNLVQLSDNWRGWSFRAWRLSRYLAINPGITPPADASSPLIQH